MQNFDYEAIRRQRKQRGALARAWVRFDRWMDRVEYWLDHTALGNVVAAMMLCVGFFALVVLCAFFE